MTLPTLVSHFSPCPPVGQLEQEWRALEELSAGSAFLSWPWIAATSIHLRPGSVLVRVTGGGQTMGLGLLGRRGRLYLNETGQPVQDRVMTEYNGLLTRQGYEAEAAQAFLAGLGRRDLILSGVPVQWQEACRSQGLKTRLLRAPQPAPFATLSPQAGHDLLAGLTRNSRQQIRRSLRYYEQQGPLVLERAQDAPQALDWLDQLELLHTASWRQRGKTGAFSDPSFQDFHRRLIAASFAEGLPDLLRLRAGSAVLGYLYTLRWRGIAAAYQSGFAFEEEPQARPGLVAHLLAMGLYRDEGLSIYRFLAGEARYKTSLATGQDELLWMIAYRPGVMRWLAETAERSVAAIRSRIGAGGSVMPLRIEVKACNNKNPS
jgi:CelD/BcsL family acetyltransferase involved in cellulose biosynthesis